MRLSCAQQQCLNLANLLMATVFDNRARSNAGTDLDWDGKGDNRQEANA